MINLLPQKDEVNKVDLIRHWVTLATTVSLALYLITLAGILGWWTYLSFQDSSLTAEVANLSSQINKFATLEATVRQIDLRQKSIDKILKTRKPVAKTVAKINIRPSDVNILGWDGTVIAASGKNSSDIEEYSNLLKKSFGSVTVDSLIQKGSSSWDASIVVKNEKL